MVILLTKKCLYLKGLFEAEALVDKFSQDASFDIPRDRLVFEQPRLSLLASLSDSLVFVNFLFFNNVVRTGFLCNLVNCVNQTAPECKTADFYMNTNFLELAFVRKVLIGTHL